MKDAFGRRARRMVLTLLVASLPASFSFGAAFEPGKIAVLRVGDGSSDLKSRQNPVFIDQFDSTTADQTTPGFSVAIPTKGTNALWINGNAYTEGVMARSGDRTALTLSGYCGDILSQRGTPSKLSYDRGICMVDVDGSTHLVCKGAKWYGLDGDKTNPRGAVTDGHGNFWGCGSEVGPLYFSEKTGVLSLRGVSSTRDVKIINNTLYTSIMASDGEGNSPGGIYRFVDSAQKPLPLPTTADASLSLAIPAASPYVRVVGFDISPKGDIAYMADAVYGVQKYEKIGADWKLTRAFYIPGYNGPGTGILTNSASSEIRIGCFGLAVDFSGANPVIYATTLDWSGYEGDNSNSNRLIRVEDTNAVGSSLTVTNNVRTLAWAGATNVCFRAIDFTPEHLH